MKIDLVLDSVMHYSSNWQVLNWPTVYTIFIVPDYLHNYGPEVWTACHITSRTFHSSLYESVALTSW